MVEDAHFTQAAYYGWRLSSRLCQSNCGFNRVSTMGQSALALYGSWESARLGAKWGRVGVPFDGDIQPWSMADPDPLEALGHGIP